MAPPPYRPWFVSTGEMAEKAGQARTKGAFSHNGLWHKAPLHPPLISRKFQHVLPSFARCPKHPCRLFIGQVHPQHIWHDKCFFVGFFFLLFVLDSHLPHVTREGGRTRTRLGCILQVFGFCQDGVDVWDGVILKDISSPINPCSISCMSEHEHCVL